MKVHYGEKLRVVRGEYKGRSGNCVYFDSDFYPLDNHLSSFEGLVFQDTYYAFLTFYNYQWHVFHYICVGELT